MSRRNRSQPVVVPASVAAAMEASMRAGQGTVPVQPAVTPAQSYEAGLAAWKKAEEEKNAVPYGPYEWSGPLINELPSDDAERKKFLANWRRKATLARNAGKKSGAKSSKKSGKKSGAKRGKGKMTIAKAQKNCAGVGGTKNAKARAKKKKCLRRQFC